MRNKNKTAKSAASPLASTLPAISNNLLTGAPKSDRIDPVQWAQLNPWLSEGQADDRTPMNGSVSESGGTASAQRAFARQSHQAMFKKWSQARHD